MPERTRTSSSTPNANRPSRKRLMRWAFRFCRSIFVTSTGARPPRRSEFRRLLQDGVVFRRSGLGPGVPRCGVFLDQSELLAHDEIDLLRNFLVLEQIALHGVAPLPDSFGGVGKPRAALGDHTLVDRDIDQIAQAGDPFIIEDIELRLLEGR